MRNSLGFTVLPLAVLSLTLVGCQTQPTTVSSLPTGVSQYKPKGKALGAEAGIPLTDALAKVTVQDIAKTMQVSARKDPFKLTTSEVKFDRQQRTERLLNEAGGYVNLFTPTLDIEFEPRPLEPKPLWRLSGIVVSEGGIVALLDMGNGQSRVIRPGLVLEGTPFVVQSLDRDRAVLRRLDGKDPRLVPIELSGPLNPVQQAAQAAPPNQGGNGGRFGAGGPAGRNLDDVDK
jgi:hypothetical protein